MQTLMWKKIFVYNVKKFNETKYVNTRFIKKKNSYPAEDKKIKNKCLVNCCKSLTQSQRINELF